MKKDKKMKREQKIIIAAGVIVLLLGVTIHAYKTGRLKNKSLNNFFEKITNIFKSKPQQKSKRAEKENPETVAKAETFKALREPVKVAVSDDTLYKQVKVQVAEEGERMRKFVDNQLTTTFAKINQQLEEHKRHVAHHTEQVKAAVQQAHKQTVGHVQDVIKKSNTTEVINKNINQAVKGIENRIQSLKQETEELHRKRYKEKKERFRRKAAESQASVTDRIRDEVKKQLTVQ